MNKIANLIVLSSLCSIGIMNAGGDDERGIRLPDGQTYCPLQNKTVPSTSELGPRQFRNRKPGCVSGRGRGYACGPRDGRGNGPRDGSGRGCNP